MSIANRPDSGPMRRPMFAAGVAAHQSPITILSVVAASRPFFVSGFLSLGTNGKTGHPIAAYHSAALARFGCGAFIEHLRRSGSTIALRVQRRAAVVYKSTPD